MSMAAAEGSPFPTVSMAVGRFPIEQHALALHAPGIARKRTVVPHHPVTRDRDSEIVRGASTGDSPNGLGCADPAGDLCVGDRLANGDLLKGVPNALLESSAAYVERQIEAENRRLDEAHDTRHEDLVVLVGPNQMGLGETILKVADQLVEGVPQKHRRYPPLAPREPAST